LPGSALQGGLYKLSLIYGSKEMGLQEGNCSFETNVADAFPVLEFQMFSDTLPLLHPNAFKRKESVKQIVFHL
jgi:hypothetical protein